MTWYGSTRMSQWHCSLWESGQALQGRSIDDSQPKTITPKIIHHWSSTSTTQIQERGGGAHDDPNTGTISKETNISIGPVASIFHEHVNVSNVSVRFAPQSLTSVHRETRIELCYHLITCSTVIQRNSFQIYIWRWNAAVRTVIIQPPNKRQ